ncbi:DNA topoisomerase [Spinellus fusiger]|nr:DNA topoisomerase [Spinellus fusiger]
MRVLCVAEKPSAAKAIATMLSNGRFRTTPTSDPYCKNYEFSCKVNNADATVVMTSVRGHLYTGFFEGRVNKMWQLADPITLFHHPIKKAVTESLKNVEKNLKDLSLRSDALFIWTDCDREGEAIGGEVRDTCIAINPRLQVWRARFSAMQKSAIERAAQQPIALDQQQIDAVEARSELDLRVGASFTRIQTLQLGSLLQTWKVLSFGSCQFPTLGFVVKRFEDIKSFVPESSWKLDMLYTRTHEAQTYTTRFHWMKDRLTDPHACYAIYEGCISNGPAKITMLKESKTSKKKPLPLTTIELQKKLCRILKISGEQIMKIAEELYTGGFISYPRTETNQYDATFEFGPLIEMQTQDPTWGSYATLLMGSAFEKPRSGSDNDKAHPPIHPTAYNDRLTGDAKSVYDYIVRRFLGSCWKDAKGDETVVIATVDEEDFRAKGLVIKERNYLDVYTYDTWSGGQLAPFHRGETFQPTELKVVEGQTTPPVLLTEPDLIALMEKHEIGTDATIAEHIQKILDRGYAYKVNNRFQPSSLGISLVLGYNAIGFEKSPSQPELRSQVDYLLDGG